MQYIKGLIIYRDSLFRKKGWTKIWKELQMLMQSSGEVDCTDKIKQNQKQT